MMNRRRCRGMFLIEMLVVIGLLAAFLIISARLLTSMIRLSRQASDAEDRIVRFDSAVRVLRGDAWSATGIAGDAGAVTIERDQTTIEWRSAEDGSLVRTLNVPDAPPQAQRWPELGGQLQFRVEGPVLIVAADDSSGRTGELRLVSQVMLAGGTP